MYHQNVQAYSFLCLIGVLILTLNLNVSVFKSLKRLGDGGVEMDQPIKYLNPFLLPALPNFFC